MTFNKFTLTLLGAALVSAQDEQQDFEDLFDDFDGDYGVEEDYGDEEGELWEQDGPVDWEGELWEHDGPVDWEGELWEHDGPVDETGEHWEHDGPVDETGEHWEHDGPVDETGEHWEHDGPVDETGEHWEHDGPVDEEGEHWELDGPNEKQDEQWANDDFYNSCDNGSDEKDDEKSEGHHDEDDYNPEEEDETDNDADGAPIQFCAQPAKEEDYSSAGYDLQIQQNVLKLSNDLLLTSEWCVNVETRRFKGLYGAAADYLSYLVTPEEQSEYQKIVDELAASQSSLTYWTGQLEVLPTDIERMKEELAQSELKIEEADAQIAFVEAYKLILAQNGGDFYQTEEFLNENMPTKDYDAEKILNYEQAIAVAQAIQDAEVAEVADDREISDLNKQKAQYVAFLDTPSLVAIAQAEIEKIDVKIADREAEILGDSTAGADLEAAEKVLADYLASDIPYDEEKAILYTNMLELNTQVAEDQGNWGALTIQSAFSMIADQNSRDQELIELYTAWESYLVKEDELDAKIIEQDLLAQFEEATEEATALEPEDEEDVEAQVDYEALLDENEADLERSRQALMSYIGTQSPKVLYEKLFYLKGIMQSSIEIQDWLEEGEWRDELQDEAKSILRSDAEILQDFGQYEDEFVALVDDYIQAQIDSAKEDHQAEVQRLQKTFEDYQKTADEASSEILRIFSEMDQIRESLPVIELEIAKYSDPSTKRNSLTQTLWELEELYENSYDEAIGLQIDDVSSQLADLNSLATARQRLSDAEQEKASTESRYEQLVIEIASQQEIADRNNQRAAQSNKDSLKEVQDAIKERQSNEIEAAYDKCEAANAALILAKAEKEPIVEQKKELDEKLVIAKTALKDFDAIYQCNGVYSVFAPSEAPELKAAVKALEDEISGLLNAQATKDVEARLQQAEASQTSDCLSKKTLPCKLGSIIDYEYSPLELPEETQFYSDWATLGAWANADFENPSCYANEWQFTFNFAGGFDVNDTEAFEQENAACFSSTLDPYPSVDDLVKEQEDKKAAIDTSELEQEIEKKENELNVAAPEGKAKAEAYIAANEDIAATGDDDLARKISDCQADVDRLTPQVAKDKNQVADAFAKTEELQAKGLESYYSWQELRLADTIDNIERHAEEARQLLVASSYLFDRLDVSSFGVLGGDQSRRLQDSLTATADDFEMIDEIGSNSGPSLITICETESKIVSMQLSYGPEDDYIEGPIHGTFDADFCQAYSLEGKVSEISFFGGSSPYLNGIKITTSDDVIEAGDFSADQEKRTVFFPMKKSTHYTQEFFGFSSSSVDSEITSLSVLAYNEALFNENKELVARSTNPSFKEQAENELAAMIEAKALTNYRVIVDDNISAYEALKSPQNEGIEMELYRPEDFAEDEKILADFTAQTALLTAEIEELQIAADVALTDPQGEVMQANMGILVAALIGAVVLIVILIVKLCQTCRKQSDEPAPTKTVKTQDKAVHEATENEDPNSSQTQMLGPQIKLQEGISDAKLPVVKPDDIVMKQEEKIILQETPAKEEERKTVEVREVTKMDGAKTEDIL